MSFMGNLLGIGGNRGMGWQASGTNIAKPTTTEQAQTAYGQTQQGLQQQQAFIQALQGQGGIQNQSNVFNQQQNLANLMQGVATGTGPNPARAQLNQATGQNIAATTAALAGARGAGSNPALAARSAARLGAETQQQAVGQGATLEAQQQIAGMDALSRQQQAMGQLAGTQVSQQGTAIRDYNTLSQQQQQNLLASINAQNQADVAMQSNINQANAAIQGQTAGGQQALAGGLIGGIGSALQLPGMGLAGKIIGGATAATGGRVNHNQIGNNPRAAYADGGAVRTNLPRIDEPSSYEAAPAVEAPQTGPGALYQGMTTLGQGIGSAMRGKPEAPRPVVGTPFKKSPASGTGIDMGPSSYRNPWDAPQYSTKPKEPFAQGGKVPALVSPGEKYLPPEQAQAVLKGKENPLNGKTIPGKAKVKGDSYENDTVPVTLEEGGCVIPRSVLQSDQPMKNAIKFVHAHMKKMAKGGKVENEKKQEQSAQEQPVPVAVAREILRNPHFLFSVEHTNPDIKPEMRSTREEVLAHLRDMGMIAEPAQGNYEGYKEPSIMVHNVTPEDVRYLYEVARRHGQESAIFSSGGKHEARYLNGPHKGKVVRGEGTEIHEKEPEDYYTKTENGLIFGHNIDWGTKYDK